MALPNFSTTDPALAGRHVVVVGLGSSGLAAARLAVRRGARVLVADQRSEVELGRVAAEVRALGAAVRTGGHPPELAEGCDLLVLSPGVPMDLPLARRARELGIPVWGEIELASRFCRGRVVAITGTNGKSTTTSMTGTLLRGAGIPGGTGGNLGTPFADLLVEDTVEAVHVLELSSFQIETLESFHPVVAALLNFTPDHLDRYTSLEAYALAKARLLACQRPPDAAILNADDPEHERFLPQVRGVPFFFSTRRVVERGAFVADGTIVLRTEAGEEPILHADDLPVPGEHNRANALAAALAGRLVGCAPSAIASGLKAYRALPHRLEYVGTRGGVKFYNDSKATNLDAAARALASFENHRVHMILGGKDKGADWASLPERAGRLPRRILLVGQASPVVRDALGSRIAAVDCGTVSEAVRVGFEGAYPGDVVLLAPGCASFDQYRNFEERGEDFTRAFRALEGGPHA